jgi:hypothetical protein
MAEKPKTIADESEECLCVYQRHINASGKKHKRKHSNNHPEVAYPTVFLRCPHGFNVHYTGGRKFNKIVDH